MQNGGCYSLPWAWRSSWKLQKNLSGRKVCRPRFEHGTLWIQSFGKSPTATLLKRFMSIVKTIAECLCLTNFCVQILPPPPQKKSSNLLRITGAGRVKWGKFRTETHNFRSSLLNSLLHFAEFFLEWKVFQTKVAEKIKTRILCSVTFLRKSRLLWDNTE